MKFRSSIYRILVTMLAVVGCSGSTVSVDSGGVVGDDLVYVSVSTISQTVEVTSRVGVGDSDVDRVYSLLVASTSGDTVAYYSDCSVVEPFKLAHGEYRFRVESGEDSAAPRVDAPYYVGEEMIYIQSGTPTYVDITARLGNARVSVSLSDIFNDQSKILDYRFSVDGVSLSREDILEGRSLYVSSELCDGEFKWELEVVNVVGKVSHYSRTVYGVEACVHYKFSFDIDQSVQEDIGYVDFSLAVCDFMAIVRDDVLIDTGAVSDAVITTTGFVSGEKTSIRRVEGMDYGFSFRAQCAGGLGEVIIEQAVPVLLESGVPHFVLLSSAGSQVLEVFADCGINISGSCVGGDMLIDVSGFANSAALGNYTLNVSAVDMSNRLVGSRFWLSVNPDVDHTVGGVESEACYAIFSGYWCTEELPDGLSFQYRISGTDSWITVPEELVNVESYNDKYYSARVGGLSPLTSYQMRSYTPSSQYDNAIEFTTLDAPDVPNLNFDDGYMDGKTWYPNASGGNSYWATGNEGVTGTFVNKPSNTYHTDDAVAGKAVYMHSIDGITMVGYAAGNLFTGTYSTNMSNPSASVNMGRPYTGRPHKLRGWYKYAPELIDGSNEMDKCHIYIQLEDDRGVIGYGEIMTDQNVEEYTQFEIEVEYRNSRKPSTIIITATSSYLGGDFICGVGSALWVDEFELLWE